MPAQAHPDPVIAAARVQHASRLASISQRIDAAITNNPCSCEGEPCEHCTRLAWLLVEAKTLCQEAAAAGLLDAIARNSKPAA